jgi:hypothetical protein
MQGLPADRLRAYLRELRPEAQALLVAELERALLRGEEVPAYDTILQELRPAMRWAAKKPLRIGSPARLFFRPVEPFIFDDDANLAIPGRVPRASLTPIWDWITAHLMPEPARLYCEHVSAALLEANESAVAKLVREFQDEAVQSVVNLLEDLKGGERTMRRVAAQIGTRHAMEELRVIAIVLRNQDALAKIASRLPAHIRNLGDEQIENLITLLQSNTRGHPDALQFGLILIANRLAAPWQLIRLAVKSAESDIAARVAQAPLAPAVTLVLADLRAGVADLRSAVREERIAEAVSLLKELHETVRALRSEMDLSGDSSWGRELAGLRAEISDLLRAEIEMMPARVRRTLRPPSASQIGLTAELDEAEVAEIEGRIALVEACRNYAGELALNQVAPRVHSEMKDFFETGTPPLLDGLRVPDPRERKYRKSQVDAAVRFSAKLFGGDYAALLAKAAGMAANDAKAIKA